MDRHAINMETDRIITKHQDETGAIPPMNVAFLRRALKAHMDETVETALAEEG